MVEINGLDELDIMGAMERRQKRYLALLLQDVEQAMANNPENYQLVRKMILDNFNDYTRSIFRVVLGDRVEGLKFR